MGLAGLTLFEQCAKYAKACGKRCILETKPIKKIDVKSLGVCFPDGSISFQTEEAAQNYARNFCMRQGLLPASEQFEVGVLRQGNRILGVAEGNKYTVGFRDLLTKHSGKDNLVLEHYHPDFFGKGKTYPLSFMSDSRVLACQNLRAIVAYNSKGQFSKAERLPILTPRLESKFSCLSIDAECQYVYDHFATEEELIMEAFERNGLVATTLYKKPSGEWIEIPSTNFKVTDKTKKKIKQICDRLSKKWSDFRYSKEYPQWANKFWEENAEKYGMKYSTNMDFSV